MQNNLIKPIKKDIQKSGAKSAYIHIPFCKRKCNYCAFTSFAALNLIDDYVKKLILEIKHFYDGTPLETLYFGGGTPSLLNIKHIEKILKLFKFSNSPEITIEVNPDSVDLNYFAALKDIGINRISIGVQSFDDDVLRAIGRIHTSNRAKDTVYLAQDVGFVSIDLIYGLPMPDSPEYRGKNTKKHHLKLWENTLEDALALDVEHISLYGLKIEDNTIFSKNPPKALPDEDLQADMYEFAIEYLSKNYELYEVSNFAKSKKYYSKHNLNYWNEGSYYGFGVSAAGFLNNIRYQNTKNFREYIENPTCAKEMEALTPENMLEETIFLGFRKMEGININKINENFRLDFNKKYEKILDKFLSTGHIEKTETGYKLTIKGVLISNVILSEFLV